MIQMAGYGMSPTFQQSYVVREILVIQILAKNLVRPGLSMLARAWAWKTQSMAIFREPPKNHLLELPATSFTTWLATV
nr:MAG: hypothetical protein J07AB56_04120 [Candidatus Nanosalinarum sp. J07AB56]